MDELKSSYCGAIFGLPLLSSPGVVTGVLLLLLSTVVSADFGAVGFPSFDPDGMLGSPLALGSGVSAANAVALVTSMAANSKLGTLIIGFSLSPPPRRERQQRGAVPKKRGR
jgi:hypothetical protein